MLASHHSGFKSPKLLNENVASYKIKSARHTNFDFKHSSDSGNHLPSSSKLFKNSLKEGLSPSKKKPEKEGMKLLKIYGGYRNTSDVINSMTVKSRVDEDSG